MFWYCEVGEGYVVFVVVDGCVFFFECVGDMVRFVVFDVKMGKEFWMVGYFLFYEDVFEYSNGLCVVLFVEGNWVWVFGVDGCLCCYLVVDGLVVWECDMVKEFGVVINFFGVVSLLMIEGDFLFVLIGGSFEGNWNIYEGKVDFDGLGLVVFDKIIGKEVWCVFDELVSYVSLVV